ncbi:hypothetical protein D0C16_14005 [Cellvibrio sp. KY-GH-1]|nr:hypothetical protein D0C16_14005 [Cellvibrio sp. KY-GH-1]
MASPFCSHSDVKPARQFVYRNMKRLIQAGELEKIGPDGGWQKYRFTESFNARLTADVSLISGQPIVQEASNISANLIERLNHQKLELLTTMGEAEEYDAIFKELPEMRGQIQSLYNDSRDRCSKLLGKVKALENLISLNSR